MLNALQIARIAHIDEYFRWILKYTHFSAANILLWY